VQIHACTHTHTHTHIKHDYGCGTDGTRDMRKTKENAKTHVWRWHKEDWRCGLSGRTPAFRALSSNPNPAPPPKKKKEKDGLRKSTENYWKIGEEREWGKKEQQRG
jgi:hypothetical protein